jgi:hypothetical protein
LLILDSDHLVAAALRRVEVERHGRRIARRRRETHFVQRQRSRRG